MLAHVLATETLRIANKCAARNLFTWQTLSATSTPVTASNGAVVTPDIAMWPDSPLSDLILLCAGYDPLATLPQGLRAWLRRASRVGAVLGGVDTGTVVLAKLGFLSGHQAVLHYEAEASFRESWPDIALSDGIYCLDSKRLTAAGGIATGDAILAWIGATQSVALADSTAEAMSHGSIRQGAQTQRSHRSLDPVIRQMTALMRANIGDPLTQAELAARLGQTPRQLAHRSRRMLGATPGRVYDAIRIEYALDLVRSTRMPVTDIAVATGFHTLAGFSRAFRQRFGTSARALRGALDR